MNVLDLVSTIFDEDAPESRPDSPPIRPAGSQATRDFSPHSPHSPRGVVGLAKKDAPAVCQGCPALELIDVPGTSLAGCVKTQPPGSPWREEWRRIAEGLACCPDKPKTATGYGCGRCGSPTYTQGPGGWCCDGCGKIYHTIGGSRGPRWVIH